MSTPNQNCDEQQKKYHGDAMKKGKNFVEIFLFNNPNPFTIHRGAQEISHIKDILGIEPFEILILHSEDGSTTELTTDKKFTVKGDEIFSGKTPTGGKSKNKSDSKLDPELFRAQFGVQPKIIHEPSQAVIIFENFSYSSSLVVDIALEWPYRPRLLFSQKVSTPKMPDANWSSSYRNVMADNRLWQGVSLRSDSTDCPIKVLSSFLGALR